jgi:hypothetical protein
MKKSRRRSPKAALRLPDLEHAKAAVLNILASPESRRSYEFAIQNFVHSYCSEPRLALNRAVVTRYRMQLEQLRLAPCTINQRPYRRRAGRRTGAGLHGSNRKDVLYNCGYNGKEVGCSGKSKRGAHGLNNDQFVSLGNILLR